MAVLQGTKALEAWCQIVTRDYPNVSITNMTSSWRSGLGFCALIHHFRPELLDYESLSPETPFENNALAFSIAEQHLGINALLDASDMVSPSAIDRLSILTYLSQFYQAFGGATHRNNPGQPGVKASLLSNKALTRRGGVDSSSSSGGPCTFCQKPVLFLLERLHINGLLAHRTCFKCARCGSQLSLANYYETEKGDFCCEICPDEEVTQVQQALSNKLKRESEEKDPVPETVVPPPRPPPPIIPSEVLPQQNEEDIHQVAEEAPKDNDEEEESPPEEKHEEEESETPREEEEKVSEDKMDEIPPSLEPLELLTEKEDENPESEIEEENQEPLESEPSPLLEDTKSNQSSQSSSPCVERKTPQHEEEESKDSGLDSSEVVVEVSQTEEDAVPSSEVKKNEEDDASEYPVDLNPFDFDEEDESSSMRDEDGVESIKALKELENKSMSASLNPFGSDFEDEEVDELPELVPPPKPPRVGVGRYPPSLNASSLNPFGSDFEDSDDELGERKARSVSPSPSCVSSMTIRSRKKRRAPPPPPGGVPPPTNSEKFIKERDNLNRRSQISNLTFGSETSPASPLSPLSPDKADGGIWKKKKGPAPPRPIPPKRQVKKIPRKAVNTELIDIEVKQLEFERQGVQLEKTIRELCEKGGENAKEASSEESLGPEAEDLIIQLFELVNEKNELFRRQTELMYMKREHRLEEEHADLEYQIRVLMNKEHPSEEQKKEEESLIARLMTVVAQRNEIVDCLEMDRLRELEEDESIEIHMGEFAAVKPPESSCSDKKKKKKKEKKKKKKRPGKDGEDGGVGSDDDKDIDTKEFPPSLHSVSTVDLSSCKTASPKKDKAKKLKKKILSSVSSFASVKR